MALSERSRHAIYEKLGSIAGKEAIGEMLTNFPTRDRDEPVTQHYLDRRLAELRTDVNGDIAELRTEMLVLRTELKGDLAELRTEMLELRTELKGDLAGLRTELKGDIAKLEVELHRTASRLIWSVPAACAAVAAAATAVARILGA
jgi:hypothetical protein